MRTCAQCGADIGHRAPDAKYCGLVCSKRMQRRHYSEFLSRQMLSCRYCGKRFPRNVTGRLKRWCSGACRAKYAKAKGNWS